MNSKMANDKRAEAALERERARKLEKELAVANQAFLYDQFEKQKKAREDRVERSKEIKKELDESYEKVRESKRSPPRYSTHNLDVVFNGQDDYERKRDQYRRRFKDEILSQMLNNDRKRQQEREHRHSPYRTTLDIGEGYHNPYLPSSEAFKYTLLKQI